MRNERIAHDAGCALRRGLHRDRCEEISAMWIRKLVAELLGTAVLVFFAVGTATLAFGFHVDGGSIAAGDVMTAMAFGLVLLALVYAIGPISGCHVNPAVTLGFVVAGRMTARDATGYWAAQFLGGLAGAAGLRAVFAASPDYHAATTGLGTSGWGPSSMIGLNGPGAFVVEIVLTFLFVLIVLMATRHAATSGFAGLAIGAGLLVVHLIGIPLTGTSVNPARSLGPALMVGGRPLAQVWLFIVAPLIGGALAAACSHYLLPTRPAATAGRVESPA
jgi:aquaporin Z